MSRDAHPIGPAILLAALISAGFACGSRAASFDCVAAQSFVERAICADPALSRADEVVAERYRAARLHDARALADQRVWLTRRSQCATVACLRASYDRRSGELAPPTAINLPGSVFGGVAICRLDGVCQQTPADEEVAAFVISESAQGRVLVRITGHLFTTDENMVSVNYKGCDMTLRSYQAHSYCPGVK